MPDAENDALTEQGLRIYQKKLQAILELQMNGRAVAIHLPSGDHTVADSHSEARKILRARHQANGQTEGFIVSRTIGPSTAVDRDMAARFLADKRFEPDKFFTQVQIDRMKGLMAQRHSLTDAERDELASLIDAELEATVARTDCLFNNE